MMRTFAAAAALLLSACATLGGGGMDLRAEPTQYSPAMSSAPGIGLTPVWVPPAGLEVDYHWTADFGYFVSWNAPNYAVVPRGADLVATEGRLYWTYDPRYTADRKSVVTIVVEARERETGRVLARRTLKLDWDRDTARVRD